MDDSCNYYPGYFLRVGITAMELFDKIQESVKAIKGRWNGNPKVGIILGTGLGGFAQEIKQEASIP